MKHVKHNETQLNIHMTKSNDDVKDEGDNGEADDENDDDDDDDDDAWC